MVVASVSSPSCAGDNGTGHNVEYSDDFLKLGIKPENLKVGFMEASIKACPIRSEKISFVKHSFVTLKLYSAYLLQIFYVTAELNRNGANGVINVRVTLRVRKKDLEKTEIKVNLYDRNAHYEVSMREVIAVLVNHSSVYNILRDNCHQYADNMFRNVVKRFGIEMVRSWKTKAYLQRALDNHPRPVLPKDVLKKRYVAGAVVGSAVTTAGVATAAVAYWPLTLLGLLVAPNAVCLTAGAISLSPAIVAGGYAMNKARRCVKGGLVS